MRSVNALGRVALALAAPAGCGPGGSGDTATTSVTTATGSSTGATDSATTSSTATSSTTSAGSGSVTSTTSGNTSSGTAGSTGAPVDCDPLDLPACELDTCVQQWGFSCGEDCPDVFFDLQTCFGIDHGCTWPKLSCSLTKPCNRVWAQGWDALGGFEDENAATCMLQSLRDGVPGHYQLLWGDMGDTGLVSADVFTDGTGTVRVQYQDTCQGCPESGFVGRTGALALQPTSFFDTCLTNPTADSLAGCLMGFTQWNAGAPPPDGWTPAFTTGTCVNLDWACPMP